MPCNYNHRRLAERVKAGIRAAGGTPMEFNTISVSDGVSMGTEGMKASLVSREVVADSIELVVRGHLLDGVVCLIGCDKTDPGRGDGARAPRRPGADPLQRDDLSGHDQGPAQRDGRVGVRGDRGVSGRARSRLDELYEVETLACPGRAPAAASTPPTRCRWCWSSWASRRPGSTRSRPRIRPRTTRRVAAGELVMDLVRRTCGRRRFVTRESLDERHRVGGRDRRLDQRRAAPAGHRPRVRDPARHRRVRGHRRPDADRRRHAAGRPLHRVRPVRRRRRRRSSCASCSSGRGCSTATRPTVDGRTIAEIAAAAGETEGQQVVRPDRDARSSRPAGWRSCAARSRPMAAS